jgi:hypothetical protein
MDSCIFFFRLTKVDGQRWLISEIKNKEELKEAVHFEDFIDSVKKLLDFMSQND